MENKQVNRRTSILAGHFRSLENSFSTSLGLNPCLEYVAPELNSGTPVLDIVILRRLLDGHGVETRDFVSNLMENSELFQLKKIGGRVFLGVDFNQSMEIQRELTMKRIFYLRDQGLFKGCLTEDDPKSALRMSSIFEAIALFDHSLSIKLGVHFHLWGGSIKYLGTKRHHDKWLQHTEDFVVKGCFAMTELGHGSNVRGIETVTTYNPTTKEFIINTPCESAQKYWIGGAANHATHTVVFSQLYINGKNEGVHAFVTQIRNEDGTVCAGVRIADCGHKIGLNGVDNGRIWFDNKLVPRENLLNSVADVTPEGEYVSKIKDPDQRFGAFMAPLTSGRVTIAVSAVYQSKIGIATAVRYALTRRAFSLSPHQPEVLLLDYPSHQQRLIPLLAKTYAMSFAAIHLKRIYVNRTPNDAKTIHVLSSGYKAMFSWHNIRSLQECREACGGQGLKTENKIGQLKAEYDVQLTFEGDNNVLMQQVSKALVAEYLSVRKTGKSFKGLGLEHMNAPVPSYQTSHLRDTQFQLSLFRVRERDLLEKLVKRMDASDDFIEHLAGDLGRAFCERSVLEVFVGVEEKTNGRIKEVLGLVRSLFVMSAIDEDCVFLKHGYISAEVSMRVENEIGELSREIREYALTLVDAFGIPSSILPPIAFDWIAANSWVESLT